MTVMAEPTQHDYQPQPHPYLHEPLLYISNLAIHVEDEYLARAFEHCIPIRPRIIREDTQKPYHGTIEFKQLEKGTY